MSKQDLDKMLEEAEEMIEKGEDLGEIESEHHGKDKSHEKQEKRDIEEEIKQARMEKNEEEEEVAAEESTEAEPEEAKEEKTEAKKQTKSGTKKIRSKKYEEALALVERNKRYPLAEAIDLVKKTSLTKFDGNVEVHVRVLGKSGKPEVVRGLIQYPHSTGRKINVAVLDEKTIDEIAKSGKADADIYLATPAQMPQVAKLAKILGPKGKMPNPKSGTVTADPEKTKKEMEAGQTEYKTDSYGIVHQVIGKVSASEKDLEENYRALLAVLPKDKIVSITLTATMGPGIRVQK